MVDDECKWVSTLFKQNNSASRSQVGSGEDSDVYAKSYTLHRAKMSRQLKELNDMLTAKEQLMSECVSVEQKRDSQQKQQQLEKKVCTYMVLTVVVVVLVVLVMVLIVLVVVLVVLVVVLVALVVVLVV